MIHLKWDPKYEIGHSVIDAEHRQLFQLATEVFATLVPPLDVAAVKGTVKSLYLYMQTHFRHEEDLMSQLQFQRYPEHILAHREIVETMNNMLQNVRAIPDLCDQLRVFMLEWVGRHILQEDLELGRCYRQRSANVPAGVS